MQKAIDRVASYRHGQKVVATPTPSAKENVGVLLIIHTSFTDAGNQRTHTCSQSRHSGKRPQSECPRIKPAQVKGGRRTSR